MKILFAADGSEHSLAALDALMARMDWFRERPSISLVNVHAKLPYPGATAWVGRETIQKYYDEESQAALQPAIQRLAAEGIPHDAVTLVGDAAAEITRHASQGGYDVIVMGTHGHTALANLVLGSVATKVLASSKVSVLFLR